MNDNNNSETMGDTERIRVAILGGAGVGKSCIVKRFLQNTYSDKYRSTVEDLYSREYDLGHTTLKVDILDTAGDMQFPAMRRLCIATAQAFLLVYATTSAPSFNAIKQCFEEIREQRPDYQEIPIVVAGNKSDLATTHREVNIEDVSEWVFCELPKLRAKVLECSAKDNFNIKELFRTFLSLSKIVPKPGVEAVESGFKRRSSAYFSATSKGRNPITSPADVRSGSVGGSTSGSSSVAAATAEVERVKPRSRSLIRRSSRKAKQQLRDAHANADECNVQ